MSIAVWLAALQGAYFGLAGIWPIVHMRSFLAVTGPKHDLWLVRTVGVLLVAISCPMLLAAWRGMVVPEVFALAVASSAAVTIIDVVYAARGTISRIYLADAVVEVALICAWLLVWESP